VTEDVGARVAALNSCAEIRRASDLALEDYGLARRAAISFLDECGIIPNPDAVDQLVTVFLPALSIISSRGYDPDGQTWREGGWRGVLFEIQKKARRLWFRSWRNGQYDHDSAIDMINYLGFYIRIGSEDGEPWGQWGNPGEGGSDD
jgi:hypothetical protein